jgi:Fe-S-cluster containining protein
MSYVPLAHPRFKHAELEVFTKRVVADCMTHRCTMHATGALKLDACCQYGADVDLAERDAIRARAEQIRPILRADARDAAWFDESRPEVDADMPSGMMVRTAKLGDGCIFLAHDLRGCAIHRASIEQGWDFRGVKPMVCRLFPLTFGAPDDDDPDLTGLAILVSDDYPDYSCAYDASAPTLYEVARDALGDIFGAELVVAMDAAAARIASTRLAVLTAQQPA